MPNGLIISWTLENVQTYFKSIALLKPQDFVFNILGKMVNENWLAFLIFLESFMVFSYILESESEFIDSILVSLWSRLNEVKVNPSRSNPGRREKNQIFIFTLLCGAGKGFMKALRPS